MDIFDALLHIGVSVSRGSLPFQLNCPFHGEDVNPSARVYPESNTLHCFTEHKTYNPVSILAAYHSLTYAGAISLIRTSYGSSGSGPVYSRSRRTRLDKELAQFIEAGLYLLDSESEAMAVRLDLLLLRSARGYSEPTLLSEIQDSYRRFWPRLAPD